MLQEYYNRRAPEYEEKYRRADPVRQAEQSELADHIRRTFVGKRVLEIACGTGFWTREAASVAKHVVATDASEEMLAIARQKSVPYGNIEFRLADAYDLHSVRGDFDGGLANFWLSHVRKADLARFLDGFHSRLSPGAAVLMADDVFVQGVGGEYVELPGDEDTYKKRKLRDGAEYVIVKNYYTDGALRDLFASYADELHVHVGVCHWWVSYFVKRAK
jgi:SAM-dependent methyltransferase